MRAVLCAWVFLVGACGSGADCKDVVERAAKRFNHATAPEVETLIGECVRARWPAEQRDCVADARDADALIACLPSPDVHLPPPKLVPSAATVTAAGKQSEPVRALLLFPPNSDVLAVVEAYFHDLPIKTERHDRFVEPELAKKFRVVHDGVVLVRGDNAERIDIDADLARAVRFELRRFDGEVARALTRLARPLRRAYLVVGHGEIVDPAGVPAAFAKAIPERRTSVLRKQLGDLGYEVANLAPAELAVDVPSSATVVLLLAPVIEPSPAEQAALARYLDRGGALLVALDPLAPPGLGALEGKLGVAFDHGHIVDDKQFVPQKHDASDRRIVVTNQFSSHASTTALARSANGLILLDSGSLTAAVPAAQGLPKLTFTIRSGASSFVDSNGNYQLDGGERRDSRNVAAAVEGGKLRALVYADVDLFADALVNGGAGRATITMVSGPLLVDAMRWLGGEEKFAPDVPEVAPAALETKESLTAELERADRKLWRALARAISESNNDARDDAARSAKHLQEQRAELRALADKPR